MFVYIINIKTLTFINKESNKEVHHKKKNISNIHPIFMFVDILNIKTLTIINKESNKEAHHKEETLMIKLFMHDCKPHQSHKE